MIAYVDRFSTSFKNEVNFDSKYRVESGVLIYAIFRALSKKANKYDKSKKAHESVLVIIDNSQTFAHLNSNIDYKKDDIWKVIDFFVSVFFATLDNVDGLEFFDEIQVYYRITFRKNIESIKPLYVVNSNMKNLYPNRSYRQFKNQNFGAW